MQSHWNRRGIGLAGIALLALGVGLAGPARGEEPAANPPAPAPAPPPVEMDRLLKLPSAPSEVSSPERAGSASKSEWRARFTSARLERDAAQTALDAAFNKIGAKASDPESWQIAPPGSSAKAAASDAPLDYALRQELRRQREELARAERRIQELTIQADLAGVPASWRE